MATSKSDVVQIQTADAAFQRVKPLLDQLSDDIQAAAKLCGDEYNALPDSEKSPFAKKVNEEYGWSQNRLQNFAKIQRKLPEKQRVIEAARAQSGDFTVTTRVAEELVRTDEKLLRKASKAGMFDATKKDGTLQVSSDAIRKLRATGQITVKKKSSLPTTDLQKVKAMMGKAEGHMHKAAIETGKIASLMYDAGITDAKGKEATAFIKTFEKLCAEVASVNPVTSRRAFQILRGEV